MGLEGNFHNQQVAEGNVPPIFLPAQDAHRAKRKSQTFFANYELTSAEDWGELEADFGALMSEGAVKYAKPLFQTPLRPEEEDDKEKQERRDAKLFSRLWPFRNWDESTVASLVFGPKEKRDAGLELLCKAPDDAAALIALYAKSAEHGAKARIPAGNSHVPRAVIEDGISRHPLLKHPAYKTVITEGAEAAKHTPSVSVRWPAGAAHAEDTKTTTTVGLHGPAGERGVVSDSPTNERRVETTMPDTGKKEVHDNAKRRWKGSVYSYSPVVLRFRSEQEVDQLIRLFYERNDELFGMPRDYAVSNTIVVPSECVAVIERKGFSIVEATKVLSPDDVPADTFAKLRSEQGVH